MRCYYLFPPNEENKREQCPNQQEDCWCSDEHRIAWQRENYGQTIIKQKQSIEYMQAKLRKMGRRSNAK